MLVVNMWNCRYGIQQDKRDSGTLFSHLIKMLFLVKSSLWMLGIIYSCLKAGIYQIWQRSCVWVYLPSNMISHQFFIGLEGLFCLFAEYRELPVVNRGECSGEGLGDGPQSTYLSSATQSQAVVCSKMSPVCWLDTLTLWGPCSRGSR